MICGTNSQFRLLENYGIQNSVIAVWFTEGISLSLLKYYAVMRLCFNSGWVQKPQEDHKPLVGAPGQGLEERIHECRGRRGGGSEALGLVSLAHAMFMALMGSSSERV